MTNSVEKDGRTVLLDLFQQCETNTEINRNLTKEYRHTAEIIPKQPRHFFDIQRIRVRTIASGKWRRVIEFGFGREDFLEIQHFRTLFLLRGYLSFHLILLSACRSKMLTEKKHSCICIWM